MKAPLPNIVMVTVDCLRADALGNAGGPAHTPQIDRLAASGVSLRMAFAHGHYTMTAMAALFSGAYPWQFGGSGRFAAERPSLPAALQAKGYHTLGVNSNPWLSAHHGFPRGFDIYVDLSEDKPLAHRLPVRMVNHLLGFVGGGLIVPVYPSGEQVTATALDLLTTPRPPFFLWLHYMDAHWPYALTRARLYGPWDPRHWAYNARLAHRARREPEMVSTREREALRELYLNGLQRIDLQIGRLLDGLEEDTIVILTADHGEAFGEHGVYFHAPALYAENVHVPWLIRAPGLPAGASSDSLVRHIDLAPTLLALAGVPSMDGVPGQNLLPYLNRSAPWPALEALSAIDLLAQDRRRIAIRRRPWTALASTRVSDGAVEQAMLFDHLQDPAETYDLASEHPHVLHELLELAGERMAENGYQAGEVSIAGLEPQAVERLKALGYLE